MRKLKKKKELNIGLVAVGALFYESVVAVLGMKNTLKGMVIAIDPPTVHEDNDGGRRLVTDGLEQKRARHLVIKCHAQNLVYIYTRGGRLNSL